MTIPADTILQEELLQLLLSRSDHSALPAQVYTELAEQHPEITEREKTQRFQNSVSLWANRVQFARLHLVGRGLLYRANGGPGAYRGIWKLTPKGVAYATKVRGATYTEADAAVDVDGIKLEYEVWEGEKSARLTSHYERNPALRAEAVRVHGTSCKACGFNFEVEYGTQGRDYIEVHHLVPVSALSVPALVNARTDMTVLCSNCHRMIHRYPDKPLTVEQVSGLRSRRRDA